MCANQVLSCEWCEGKVVLFRMGCEMCGNGRDVWNNNASEEDAAEHRRIVQSDMGRDEMVEALTKLWQKVSGK